MVTYGLERIGTLGLSIQESKESVLEKTAQGIIGELIAGGIEGLSLERVKLDSDRGTSKFDIANTLLSLDEKIKVENLLRERLQELVAGRIIVNFKKSSFQVGRPPKRSVNHSQKPIKGVRKVIAVASGKGGVGKSTVSFNLAVTLAKLHFKVGLVDADIYGPSMALMAGSQRQIDINADSKIEPPEAFGVKVSSFGYLLDEDQPVIWRGPLVSKAVRQLFFDVNWGELDYLIVDLPPGTGDIHQTILGEIRVDNSVVVTTPQDLALLDAAKAIRLFQRFNVPMMGVLENMAIHFCEKCGHGQHIFGRIDEQKLQQQFGTGLLQSLPLHEGVSTSGDSGVPAVSSIAKFASVFNELARSLVEETYEAASAKQASKEPFSSSFENGFDGPQ